jgi:hypothetical protein
MENEIGPGSAPKVLGIQAVNLVGKSIRVIKDIPTEATWIPIPKVGSVGTVVAQSELPSSGDVMFYVVFPKACSPIATSKFKLGLTIDELEVVKEIGDGKSPNIRGRLRE